VLTLAHPGGLRTSLEPVRPLVVTGQQVRRGAAVAVLTAERGHCGAETCLHWGVRRGQVYLDPLALLGPPDPPVLLPQLTSRSFVRSCTTAFVCIWQMRDSVTPRIRPISASVRPS
jgi:murein DD-endopeptidase MepM/ murein hydrolase activator NlpD